MNVSRRGLTAILLCVPITTIGASSSDTRQVPIHLNEVTNIAATASPDGRELMVDAQGVLWRLPIEGGEARRVTDFDLGPARPQWSPTGERVVFQAYREGTFDVWTMAPDGSDLEQHTEGPWDEREPAWSPDGKRIAFASDRDGSYDIWVLDVASGALSQWTSADTEEAYPAWSPNGDEIAYVVGNTILATDASGATRTLVDAGDAGVVSPAWTPSGDDVAYIRTSVGKAELMLGERRLGQSQDVFPFRPEFVDDNTVLYSADGHIRTYDLAAESAQDVAFTATLTLDRPQYRRKDFRFGDHRPQRLKGIMTPSLAPDGKRVAFVALNDLWLMRIGQRPRRLTHDTYYESDPAWSADGEHIAYVSDRAGDPDIWIRNLATGEERRLGEIQGAELYPAWSPKGRRIAYQDQNGATYVADVASGVTREVAGPVFQPGRVSWSPDGQRLAYAVVVPYTSRFREGTSQIRVVNVQSGESRFVPPAPNKSITTRADDGPVWSPDGGAMAFIMEGRLHVAAVKANGQITGEPQAITDALADSPTWSGDGSQLLYLANGRLKLVGRNGGASQDVPLPLHWRNQRERGARVVHAGKLWDGNSVEVRHDMDILVVGDRIRWVTSHHDWLHKFARHGDRLIDASDLTVVPGLFEMHTHQTWGNHTYGYAGRQSRLLLAFGITSTHSVGDLAYRAIADREAIASGARVGPRFFATGEPLDGDRIYYNAMRPMVTDEQFELELERAEALGYDNIKTYVRLRPERMGEAARAAHELGVSAYSHFLSPGVLVGQDGTTHLGATERLDYSRISSLTGKTYDDVVSLFADGGMSVMTTFFIPEPSLFSAQTDILNDPRVKRLIPFWEQQALADGEGAFDNPASAGFLARIADNPETFAQILRRGGTVLAGTDSPLDTVAVGLHSNLRWLENNAFTPFEALRTATSLPAKELGVAHDLGTIERGKLADMVFVEGDPHREIEDLINVRMVMKAGRLHTTEELIEPYPESVPQR